MQYDSFTTHDIDMFMGKPKSGKTLIAASYPKPMLYISVGNDGGGKVIDTMYHSDVVSGNIRVKNLRNDLPIGGKILQTSCEKLINLLAELRKPGSDKFKTIVIDTLGSLQDDYKTYMEFNKKGLALSQQEWGDVAKMMLMLKDVMKRFSEDLGVKFVWVTHTNEQEVYETSGLNKEIRIIPDLTIKTGVKYMKDASNIFYQCRKTVLDNKGEKDVKFLTYVGPHPLIDTGTRDIILSKGGFVENFTYDKWQEMVKAGKLSVANILVAEEGNAETANNNDEGE